MAERPELAAVLAPGYGGSSEQPIVQAMARRLEAVGIQAQPISFSRARPGGDLEPSWTMCAGHATRS